MTKYAFQVDVPKEGPLTREQGWAALDRLMGQMGHILDRMNAARVFVGGPALYTPKEGCVLPEDELEEAISLQRRFVRLVKMLSKDVLDQLADIKPDDLDPGPDPWGVAKFPANLRWLINDIDSDLFRYVRQEDNGSAAVVALALLEQEDRCPGEISEIIEKLFGPNQKGGCWWSCPFCDEWEAGFIDHEECAHCYGWGYVNGERPDYDNFPRSRKGRLAMSKGLGWSDAQEKEAWAEENPDDEED